MSWATPVRSHVVVTMMARSITVERSVPALLGLARVSGLGMGMGMGTVFILYQGFRRKNYKGVGSKLLTPLEYIVM